MTKAALSISDPDQCWNVLGVIWGEDHALRFVPQVTVRSLSVLWEVRGEPSGNRSVLRAAFTTEPAVLEHSLRWIESPKLGSSIQRVVTGHFKGPIRSIRCL